MQPDQETNEKEAESRWMSESRTPLPPFRAITHGTRELWRLEGLEKTSLCHPQKSQSWRKLHHCWNPQPRTAFPSHKGCVITGYFQGSASSAFSFLIWFCGDVFTRKNKWQKDGNLKGWNSAEWKKKKGFLSFPSIALCDWKETCTQACNSGDEMQVCRWAACLDQLLN